MRARLFLLDTNMVSYLVKGRSSAARERLLGLGEGEIACVSAVTEGEIRYGLAKRPDAVRLTNAVYAVLDGLEILPWSSLAASVYGAMRAENERRGTVAGNLDMLIAAHALATGSVLVTNDKALQRLFGGPNTVNWATDLKAN